MATNDTPRIAVLIDADDASAALAKVLFGTFAKYGAATVKCAYGDLTTQNLVDWKDRQHQHVIQPVQQVSIPVSCPNNGSLWTLCSYAKVAGSLRSSAPN